MAAGDPGTRKRNYSAVAVETKLTNSISSASQGDTTTNVIVNSVSGFPSTLPYTLIIDPDTSKEEVVTVTAATSTTLTITRGQDNTQAQAHSANASVRHGVSAREFRELQTHIAARGVDADSAILSGVDSHVHGLVTGDGSVVGSTQAVVLTRKTLGTGTSISSTVDNSGGTISGGTITTTTVTASTVRNSTLTSDTLGSDLAAGGYKITNLGAPTSDNDAARKIYVDGILGSAVAASASATAAAASAATAATSAASAATYATNASNSANASATSASASATSAGAAATSATNAANSATSSANSATASATSAGQAASSATAAAASASAAATSASDAATTYDNFDDRYLGNKSSAPTVDNDGNSLLVGAIYWNSTLNNMYVWSGSTWVQIATTSVYTAPTIGSTPIPSGTTVSTIAGLTLTTPNVDTVNASTVSSSPALYSNVTTGTITIGSGLTSGSVVIANGTSFANSVNIASGATTGNKFVNIGANSSAGTTTINIGSVSGATSNVAIRGTVTVPGDINLTATGGPGSLIDELTLLLMGAL